MRRASGPSSPGWSGPRGSARPDAASVEDVRRVEEDLLAGLALLADETRDAEAAAAELAGPLAAALEVAAAEAPASSEMLVDLGERPDVERPLRRRAHARARRAAKPRATEAPETHRRDGGDDRDREEEADHPARATATNVCTIIASVRMPPSAKAIVR